VGVRPLFLPFEQTRLSIQRKTLSNSEHSCKCSKSMSSLFPTAPPTREGPA
jgi:hypothetical protein